MMDVNAGVGAVAGAPAVGDAAAGDPMQPKAAAPAPGVAALFGVAARKAPAPVVAPVPVGPEAAAVTPVLLGIATINEQEVPAQVEAKLKMGDVAKMLREKTDADKVESARKRDALKKAAAKTSAPVKQVVAAKGKAASAKAGAKKVVAAKGKAEPHPKVLAIKNCPEVSKGGSCPDESLAYRGPAYAKVRYYKESTIYHDAGNHQWRVKPSCGSRQTIKIGFKTNPKQAWANLVETIRKLNP